MKSPNILQTLVDLAKQGLWENVDALLSTHANDIAVITWARVNTQNRDLNLRDLSASIYEVSTVTLEENDIEKLLVMMREQIENPYPRFRAACALVKRANTIEKYFVGEAKVILREHLNDEDVADIAKTYLGI